VTALRATGLTCFLYRRLRDRQSSSSGDSLLFRFEDNLCVKLSTYAFGGLVAEATASRAASRGLSPLHRLRVMGSSVRAVRRPLS